MPTATSRRKSRRRQASSDVEDGQSTQRSLRDDVDEEEDEDEQPRPTKRTASSKKGKGRAIAVANAPADGDQDYDGDRIDVSNFVDQPLRKEDIHKINGLGRDWASVADKIAPFGKVFGSVGAALADTTNDETAQKSLLTLENLLKGFIDTQAEMRLHTEALEDITQDIAKGDQVDDPIKRYEAGVEAKKEKYEHKTSRQKYAKDEFYKQFKTDIYEVHHPGEAMPPVTNFIPKEDGDDSDDDDDLEIGGVTQDYKCPITLLPLQNPVTSEICGHSFSKEALKQMFMGSKAAKKCPAAGCNKSFTYADCKDNKPLEKKIKAFERRQKRKEEEEDDGEVIE
ncbi:hypothetical protein D9758_002536 [Tetrapyrgos nigripes]|uniref:SP-RING-type domain-containing protein n=1 Tax=Tetrapyrgos nigripes TaxID=182062 RepID=A0A8H5LTZ5_9AGAR|nr:hypothetical protein D9758_002536 [Tetrapyrgos nigripes]